MAIFFITVYSCGTKSTTEGYVRAFKLTKEITATQDEPNRTQLKTSEQDVNRLVTNTECTSIIKSIYLFMLYSYEAPSWL